MRECAPWRVTLPARAPYKYCNYYDYYYFSWLCVQHMLPYGTGISRLWFIYISFLICECAFFYYFCKSDIETPDRNGQWYQHLLTWLAFFFFLRDFRIMFICFTFSKCACFVLYSTCVKVDPVKSPEVTLCSWGGYKPSQIIIMATRFPLAYWTSYNVLVRCIPLAY